MPTLETGALSKFRFGVAGVGERRGGTVDENRNGVPLALPVLGGFVWIFVDERHARKKDSALLVWSSARFRRRSRHASVTQA